MKGESDEGAPTHSVKVTVCCGVTVSQCYGVAVLRCHSVTVSGVSRSFGVRPA